MESLSFVTDQFTLDGARIDAGKALLHRRGEQRDVRDLAKMFGNEPDRLLRSHPVKMIKAGEIYRT